LLQAVELSGKPLQVCGVVVTLVVGVLVVMEVDVLVVEVAVVILGHESQ
jgi:hypothetical protein